MEKVMSPVSPAGALDEVLRRLRFKLHLAQGAGIDAMVVNPTDLAAVLDAADVVVVINRNASIGAPWPASSKEAAPGG